jgi:hypothetical protein
VRHFTFGAESLSSSKIADARKAQDAFHSGNSSMIPAFIMSERSRNGVEKNYPRKKIARCKTTSAH